jgi:Putative lumazine-binding
MLDARTCADITKIVATYVEGMCQNDAEKLRHALHEKCCSIGHYEGGLEWDHREAFIAVVNAAVEVPDPAPWYAINSILLAGDVAAVQVENIWLGMHFVDTLTLLCREDRWVIVSKVFYHRQAGQEATTRT